MGLLRADRITGLGGANAITGSTQFDGDLHYQGNFLAIGDSDDFNDWGIDGIGPYLTSTDGALLIDNCKSYIRKDIKLFIKSQVNTR